MIFFFSQNGFKVVIDFMTQKHKKHMFPDLLLLVSIVMNAEVWSGNQICFENKGLIIVLSFNHQLVQSEQAWLGRLASQSGRIIESAESALETLLPFPT